MPESRPPATFVTDLRPNRLASLEGTVVALEPIREVEVPGGAQKRVRTGRLKDATGEIALTLWGEEVELVQEGDRIRIQEGWVKDYKGRPQVSLGRLGKLTKLTPPATPDTRKGDP